VPRDDGGGLHDLHGPPSAAPHSREQHSHKSRSVRLSRSRRGAACWRTASWWRTAKISAWSSTRVRRLDRMAATRAVTLGCLPCTVSGETGKLNRHKRYRLSGRHRSVTTSETTS
jgi:hypothetical protein